MIARRAVGRLLVVLALVATGCALRAPGEAPTISGVIAVRIDEKPVRQFSADFDLQGDAQQGLLRLSGPLGATAAEARWSSAGATLVTAQGSQSYPDTDSLAQAALGERLPLAALIDWLRGRPWPMAPSEPADFGFAQLGWRIDLSRFGQGWIEARRDLAPAVTVRARVEPPAERTP